MTAELCFNPNPDGNGGVWSVQLHDEYASKQAPALGEGEATELAIEILKRAQDARTRQAKEPKKAGRNDY